MASSQTSTVITTTGYSKAYRGDGPKGPSFSFGTMKMRSVEEKFYKTKAWKNCRIEFLKANPLCEECQKKGRYTPATHVHHRVHLTEENISRPEISLSWGNLEAVCIDCHNRIHFGKGNRRYSFDKDGNLVIDD